MTECDGKRDMKSDTKIGEPGPHPRRVDGGYFEAFFPLVAALTRAENPRPGLPARPGETNKRIV